MEALANVNQFGVCELKKEELMEVDGGVGFITLAFLKKAAAAIVTCYTLGVIGGEAKNLYDSKKKEANKVEPIPVPDIGPWNCA